MAEENADSNVTFSVKASSGPKISVTLPTTTTIADLKTKLAEPDMANVPAASQRLIYSGKVLKDADTLATYNVKEGNTMHLVRSAASNQRQTPAAAAPPADSTSTTTPAATGIPQNFAAGTGNDMMANFTGARFAGMPGMPSLESLAGSTNMTEEDMLRRLEDPNFLQQMNEALSNPQMIDMMIQSSPQLRAMGPMARQQLMSPEFRRMILDPNVMRQSLQMQRMMGGGGGQNAFPMPGDTNATDSQQNQGQNQAQQNPFASMFGGAGAGAGGMNPFMFMQPPPTGTDRAADPSNPSATDANAANPFAALLNNPGFGPFGLPTQQAQTGQQAGQTGTTTTGLSDTTTNPTNPPNPTAQDPWTNMMNNPMMQQMMQNPEALRNAMQAMGLGGGMGGGMGNDMFGGLGGFGAAAPPDNRPPEERYSTQLRQLNEMGFHDFDRNIQALGRSGGDVNGALEWLFSQP